MQWLARKTPNTPLRPPNPALDATTLQQAQRILDAVNDEGVKAVRRIGEDLGDLNADSPLFYTVMTCSCARRGQCRDVKRLKCRRAVRAFADAQRNAVRDITQPIAGGTAGLRYQPVDRGLLCAGGRFPLPSSVLMTTVYVQRRDERMGRITQAPTRHIGCGGSRRCRWPVGGGRRSSHWYHQRIRPIPACATIVGPGNRWVTAEEIVSGTVAIDAAGPSELMVIADDTADPERIARTYWHCRTRRDAIPVLICKIPLCLNASMTRSMPAENPPHRIHCKDALKNGWSVWPIAPKPLRWPTPFRRALVAPRQQNRGYPNLPMLARLCGRGAQRSVTLALAQITPYPPAALPAHSALSVIDFLRVQTWIEPTPLKKRSLLDTVNCTPRRPRSARAFGRATAQVGPSPSRPRC